MIVRVHETDDPIYFQEEIKENEVAEYHGILGFIPKTNKNILQLFNDSGMMIAELINPIIVSVAESSIIFSGNHPKNFIRKVWRVFPKTGEK